MLEKETNKWGAWLDKWFYVLLFLGVAVNASGLFITILDSDGTLYACIAKTMAQTGDFINLKVVGTDWLDKPHFPFWMAAISYKIFGINTFAYKIPALLFWGMGGAYTFLFASKVNGKNIARVSVLMYITATHLFISNNDVRAEPYLTGLLIGSIYHFYLASGSSKWFKDIVIASFFAGCAAMTKGPFILIPIAGGFIVEWAIKKEWQQLLSIKWLVALALVLVFTLPELYCLYVQFDLHPEKIVFDKTGVSGLRFFFWDSQFGRFFNNGPIRGEGDKFFYFHTMLWAFLPWSLVFYMAFGWKLWTIKKAKELTPAALRLTPYLYQEYVTLGSGGLMFLIFSLSKFQLPHYLNILFPFFSIITAQYICQVKRPAVVSIVRWVQYVVVGAMLLVGGLLLIFYRPEHNLLAIILLAGTATGSLLLFNGDILTAAIGKSFITAIGVFAFLNCCIYPSLMQYQAGSKAAFYINEKDTGVAAATMFNENSYSFTFYTKAPIFFGGIEQLKVKAKQVPIIVYTNKEGLDSLRKVGFSTNIPVAFNFFHASELTGEFINYKTRAGELKQHYIVKVRYP
ncbi:ArnT family glycosyltransferase [Parasediminibacterium sp. JCM 36343]|uniref:ArnT family glycosyltransferase n=1 Tax=Parasediminibacterium sp. JCM 36343 TaxID=3374279 RepID=UPI003978A9D7